jgi:hypothetical protein
MSILARRAAGCRRSSAELHAGVLALALLALLPAPRATAQPFTPDPHTLLLLHFDGSAGGAQGETPLTATGLAYTAGVIGQAVVLAPGAALSYARVGNLVGERGTLEFWFKPAWRQRQTHMLLSAEAGAIPHRQDGATIGGCCQPWGRAARRNASAATSATLAGRRLASLRVHRGPTALKLSRRNAPVEVTPSLAPPARPTPRFSSATFKTSWTAPSTAPRQRAERRRDRADYLAGVTLLSLSVAPDPTHVWSTWPVRFTLQATSNLGPVAIPQTSAAWTSSDTTVVRVRPAGDLRALAGGTALLTATVKGVSASAQAIVRAPVLAPHHTNRCPPT